jgi:hypothetical protein
MTARLLNSVRRRFEKAIDDAFGLASGMSRENARLVLTLAADRDAWRARAEQANRDHDRDCAQFTRQLADAVAGLESAKQELDRRATVIHKLANEVDRRVDVAARLVVELDPGRHGREFRERLANEIRKLKV